MKVAKFLPIALVALAAASTAVIAQPTAGRDADLPTAKSANTEPVSRAEVKSELKDAQKSGEMNQGSHANPQGAEAAMGKKKTRAEVKAETAAAKAANGGQLKTPKE